MIVYLTVSRLFLPALQLGIMGFKVNKFLTLGFFFAHFIFKVTSFFVVLENYSTCLSLILLLSES